MNRKNSLLLWSFILVVIALIFFFLWLFVWRFSMTTDDAYVNGNRSNVTSVISGTPIAFFADDTDFVREGELLVLLDKTPFEAGFEREIERLANIAQRVLELDENVYAKKAALQKADIEVNRARYDYSNRKALVESKAIAREEFIHSQEAFHKAEAAFQEAESQLKMAKALRGPTPIREHPLLLEQIAITRKAYYDLYHTEIVAPVSGNIGQRAVQIGQWVNPSQFLMAIIPQTDFWVDANFKETELQNMRVGQKAEVTIDLYGSSVKFEGKVAGIASGTGSVFSLIPPQNATGNWIKIVQRLPVRILLNPDQIKKHPLRLGLSARVTVDLHDQSLPYLVEVPTPLAPKATTSAFDIDFAPFEKQVENILDGILYGRKR